MVEYRTIKITKAVHKILLEDKKHFTEVIGIPFSFSHVILEYKKIMGVYKR